MPDKRLGWHRQRGFSLPEVLVAALLFAVSLLGLLHYHQVLLQSFQRQRQYHQAWLLAHQQLEILNAGVALADRAVPLPVNWQREVTTLMVEAPCRRLTVTISTPLRQQAQLSRWYCANQ